MRNRTATTEKPAEPTPAEVLAALDRRISALQERDAGLLREQLDLEKSGAVAVQPSMTPPVRRRSLELLNGEAPPHLVGLAPGERLFAVLHERAALKEAILLGGSQRIRAEIAVAAAAIAANRDKWAAIVRKRIKAILELRTANREAMKFKSEMNALAGVGLDWPCDPFLHSVFGADCHLDDPCLAFLETAIREGFCTEGEIA